MLTSFHLLILCQILLQQFSINKWEIWTFINHFPVTINEMTNQVSLLPSYYPHLQLKIEAISNISNVLYFDSLKQTFFRIDSRMWNYVKCKMSLNNLTSSYQNVSIIQIEFCFPKLYFRKFIRTQMECISWQLLVDDNWLNKAIWKSALCKSIKHILLREIPF